MANTASAKKAVLHIFKTSGRFKRPFLMRRIEAIMSSIMGLKTL